MDRYTGDLISHLTEFVTPNRQELFQKVLAGRTRYLAVLLEDIYQSQNASAVLRTCDLTGIQDVHIVEQRNEYDINRDVALGSDQWLTFRYYGNMGDPVGDAVNDLKNRGYRIVATSPHTEGATPETFDLERGKAVFMFGTELTGLSERALELADEFIRIPMVGFTESFNISVSAAVILYVLKRRLEQTDLDWGIADEERSLILLEWLRSSIRMSEQIERKFRSKY
jgi:tRNA (guanosine-2'-O-)-methyltransferase